jgi:hypothetical protein
MVEKNTRQVSASSVSLVEEHLTDEAQDHRAESDSREQASPEDVCRQAQYFAGYALPRQLFEATPSIVLVLNLERQVVYANLSALQMLGLEDEGAILGLRYGEVLGCVHAFKTPEGCGTTEFCRACGAACVISSSRHGQAAVEEWRITRKQDEGTDALVLRVWATPFEIGGEGFTIFASIDVSNEKRRQALERIFFHDILNTAGMLLTTSDLLVDADPDLVEGLKQKSRRLTRRLVNEIEAQRDLTEAENYELSVRLSTIHSLEFLQQISDVYLNRTIARERRVCISSEAADITFVSDSTLLERVIGNMVKNALEASQPGQTVTLGCQAVENQIEFWVHNVTFMPKEVQLQVFQRAFSTRGTGRGLGTYSMKLLSQRYLGGDVSFASSEDQGTTFRARYPLQLQIQQSSAELD